MPSIQLPKGLRGKKNSPKQSEYLANCFYKTSDVPTITPRPGVNATIDAVGYCRGSGLFKEELYQVSNDELIKITFIGSVAGEIPNATNTVYERLGEIDGSGDCILKAGFTDLCIMVKNGKAYVYNEGAGLREISDPQYKVSVSMDYDGGRFVFIPANGGPFFWTDLADPTSIDPKSFADAEEFPDPNKGIITRKKSIYVLGTRSVEALRYNASIDTYQAIQGVSANVGYVGGLTELGEDFVFLGRGKNGGYSFYGMSQFPTTISNETVDEIINNEYSLEELEGVTADYFRWEGQDIAIFHLPRHTFAFYGDWAVWYSGTNNNDNPTWRIRYIQFAYGYLWTGDKAARTIGVLVNGAKEYDSDIEGEIATYLRSEPRSDFVIDRLYCMCTTGQSNIEKTIGLRVSEGGLIYGPEQTLSLGAEADYNKEISWGPVGSFDNHMSLKLRWVGDVSINVEGITYA